jgi:putative transposase
MVYLFIGRANAFTPGLGAAPLDEKKYHNFKEAQQAIAAAISVYNHIRPHSSIDMLTPVEAHLREGELKRRWKNYYSKRKEVAMT